MTTGATVVWVHPLDLTGYITVDGLVIGSDGAVLILLNTYKTRSAISGGYSYTDSGGSFLVRYNPADESIWAIKDTVQSWHGISAGVNGAVFESGAISATGSSLWSRDAIVVRFNSDGSQAWSRQFGGDGDEIVTTLAPTRDGSIYAAGPTSSSFDGQINNGGLQDGFITRFSADGNRVWTKLVGGPGVDGVNQLVAGSDGSIFLGVVKDIQLNSSNDPTSWTSFINRYNAQGDLIWSAKLANNGLDVIKSMTAGQQGEIYTGLISDFTNDLHTYQGKSHLSRYNPDGSRAWDVPLGGNGASFVTKVFYGSNGAIYVSGVSWASAVVDLSSSVSDTSVFIEKYNPNGSLVWSKSVLNNNDSSVAGFEINGSQISEEDGSLYLTGVASAGFTLDGATVSAGATPFIFKLKIEEPATINIGNHSPTGTVTIAGAAKLGQALVATNTLADPDGLGAIAYKWMADSQLIDGATEPSFTLTQAQMGKSVTAVASYTDGGGTLESVASSAIQVANYNTTASENATVITNASVVDPLLGRAPKYTLTGADAAQFKISTKGALTFATAKDYEQPVDANKDGIYEVSVTMTNAKTGYTVVKDLTVGVEFTPILGSVGADKLAGTAGYDTLDGKGGDDKLTGGAGLDTFLVTSGRDSITDLNLLTKGATGSEVLQVSAGATADATLKAAWAATADSFNAGTANIFTSGMSVDLSAVAQGQGWNVTNTGVATTISGSQFNDTLTGGTGNDLLNGGAGNDRLAGGKGSDVLTGGAGADAFLLSGDTKTDHITDFLSGTDRIELDNALFKALLVEGQLAANQFAQGTAATTAAQRIVYDSNSGNLWYDLDGSAKGKAVLVAVLDNQVQVANTDFWVI